MKWYSKTGANNELGGYAEARNQTASINKCIDLMNIGSEPNSALRHVKKAFELNDNEVTLVSHAVNNSKQLSHLQNSDSKDKDKPFPLTSAEQVTGANSKADMDVSSDQSKAKEEQPRATSLAWPLQRALPELDNLRKALSDLKPIVTYR